ncbi:MAG: GGDEF domain-containing protein, partial [Pseudomonadota bacterium]
MKYHHSVTEAQEYLNDVFSFLEERELPCNPINYSVGYDFLSKTNKPLVKKLEHALNTNQTIDTYFIESLYDDFIKEPTRYEDKNIRELSGTVGNLKAASDQSKSSIEALEHEISTVRQEQAGASPELLDLVEVATKTIKDNQTRLEACVAKAHKQTLHIQAELEQARMEALTDTLTKIQNRKGLSQFFSNTIKKDPTAEIAAIILDIDHFKSFNDNFGHLIGDVILRRLANTLQSATKDRGEGEAFRFGGEEFVLILPHFNLSKAKTLAENVRQHIAKMRLKHMKTEEILPPVTISLGVTMYQAKEPLDTLLNRADEALY